LFELKQKMATLSSGVLVTVLSLAGLFSLLGCTQEAREPHVLISPAACARNQAAGTITYISGYGYSASAGQLDVFVAKELGLFDALCLDVVINAAGANGQLLVSSGRAQFTALGSASDVMLAAANSGNLVAVATYGSTSPFAIFANENIKTLKDLEGGRLGYFINLTPVALAMLDAAGVDRSKVQFVKMTNYDPTVVIRGQVDAIVGYASNQVQTLRAMQLPFSEFRPADFGFSGTYNVMEVNREFLRQHRDTAADFMRASLKALEFCLAEQTRCIEILHQVVVANKQGAAFPREQLARTWSVESEWVRTSRFGPPGMQTVDGWQEESHLVHAYGGLAHPPVLEHMLDVELVAALYQGTQLQWPGR